MMEAPRKRLDPGSSRNRPDRAEDAGEYDGRHTHGPLEGIPELAELDSLWESLVTAPAAEPLICVTTQRPIRRRKRRRQHRPYPIHHLSHTRLQHETMCARPHSACRQASW